MSDSDNFYKKPTPSFPTEPVEVPNNADDCLEILLFETSPYGNIDAIVQHDGRTVYFYLHPRDNMERFSPKGCWVRNLQTGPFVINHEDFVAGRQVALPRTHTTQRQPGKLPTANQLEVVWFEEGNGAALIESTSDSDGSTRQTLAVIPPWSGLDGFHGYAAECASDSPLCWPLPRNPKLQQRIDQAADFWRSFSQSSDPFVVLRDQILDRYHAHFLKGDLATTARTEPQSPSVNRAHTLPNSDSSARPLEGEMRNGSSTSDGAPSWQYFDIGGQGFPPRGMIHYSLPDRHVIATIGMSLCPQPNVELFTTEPEKYRRIELGVQIPKDLIVDSISDAYLENFRLQIARMGAYPWNHFRWLKGGDTVQFPGLSPATDQALLTCAEEPLAGFRFRDDPVQLLWFVPAAEKK